MSIFLLFLQKYIHLSKDTYLSKQIRFWNTDDLFVSSKKKIYYTYVFLLYDLHDIFNINM